MSAVDLEAPRLRLAPFRADEAGLLHQLWMAPLVRRYLWDDQVKRRSTVQGLDTVFFSLLREDWASSV